MQLPSRTARRATRRRIRAIVRARAAHTRLVASTRRRPRALATFLVAAGVDRDTAAGAANSLRGVAKRLAVAPAQTVRTHRSVANGSSRTARTVNHWTRDQVAALTRSWSPRKAEYIAARARLLEAVAA